VLVEEPGSLQVGCRVADDDLAAALEELSAG
jgi:hypothetical protein